MSHPQHTPTHTPAHRATVVITTRNRKQELEGAVATSLEQSCRPDVLVLDDASTDGTDQLMRDRFPSERHPQLTYHRYPEPRGYIVNRNAAASIITTPYLVSLDDDAYFPSTSTVEQTLAEFTDPRIGAVAIPYADILKPDNSVRQRSPDPARLHALETYVGTAHCLRRDLFLALGGYREAHVHQGEEGDYCLRLLARGYVVRAGSADPISHLESPKRDLTRLMTFNARNHLLFAWHNIPAPRVYAKLPSSTVKLLIAGWQRGYLKATCTGLRRGYGAILSGSLQRDPVSPAVYSLWRDLFTHGPLPLDQIAQRLPAPMPFPPAPIPLAPITSTPCMASLPQQSGEAAANLAPQ